MRTLALATASLLLTLALAGCTETSEHWKDKRLEFNDRASEPFRIAENATRVIFNFYVHEGDEVDVCLIRENQLQNWNTPGARTQVDEVDECEMRSQTGKIQTTLDAGDYFVAWTCHHETKRCVVASTLESKR